MQQPNCAVSTPLGWICKKCAIKSGSHSFRITCDKSEVSLLKIIIIIIIIMYIYHALMNALSAHMIHINLNYMILYTHVEQSPIKNNLHKVL